MTGGAGFIGCHLVNKLATEGFEVTVLDNLSSGKMENITQYAQNERLRFVRGDILDRQAIREALKNIDAVFHLAAITSVPYSVNYPDITHRVNVEGTRMLLEACLSKGIERFIYVSSCAVYGEPEYLPVDEKHPVRPISPYAKSKLEAERLCIEFQEKYRMKITILRPFNVYGPRMKGGQYGGVITRFIEKLRFGNSPIIYGDGEQTRDFVHVEDVVRAMVLALSNEKSVSKTINIGTGIPTSINQLAQLIIELYGANGVKPKYRRARKGEIKHSYADIREAKISLGYEPKVTLKDGLSALLDSL